MLWPKPQADPAIHPFQTFRDSLVQRSWRIMSEPTLAERVPHKIWEKEDKEWRGVEAARRKQMAEDQILAADRMAAVLWNHNKVWKHPRCFPASTPLSRALTAALCASCIISLLAHTPTFASTRLANDVSESRRSPARPPH